ncbi:antigen 5 like allergen Cul n 1-like [Condylostylus longicornis]|uniref:antigen 5 like allergen Cul n 1-like n=1 Tax=Condylostylus longicornis TaxID=2530218 RepID=UPI00244D9FC1|nr:antigen 5 like allergen Cul n 1-like [Condylostylus longicornis]
MFKILLICVLSFAICSAQNPTQVAQNYCKTVNCKSETSIACQYKSNANMKCKGQLQKLDNEAIVKYFNSKRNDIALGKVTGYEPAVNMQTIKWNKELEQMAKYNVMTCKFEHDKCRNTNNFRQSGQNLYYMWSTKSNVNISSVVLNGLKSWFDEYKLCDMSYIDNYRNSPNMIGHFTAMVKDNNNYLGCALNKYPSDKGTTYLLACNFASTNVLSRPIYLSGPSASKCPGGKNSQYPGLCK